MAVQEVGAFLGIAVLGGLWAVAWGRRRSHPTHAAMLDARTQVQARLDALRARTAALARRDLPPEARGLIDDVVEHQVLIDAILRRAASPEEVAEVAPEIDDALALLEQAAATVGLRMPALDPFDGLCASDPAHGLAEASENGTASPLCRGCTDATARGSAPPRRMVTRDGRPVPFDQPGREG